MAEEDESQAQDGEPFEDIWRLFVLCEDAGDIGGANEPIVEDGVFPVMEYDDDATEDEWTLFQDNLNDNVSNSPRSPASANDEEPTQNMAVINVAQDATPRPRAASDVSERPRSRLPDDSGIDSSSPQSSNFSSVDPLEPRRGSEVNADPFESDMQTLSQQTMGMSSTMPRSARRRAMRGNEATPHTKKPRNS